jgi:hypothetical protein
MQHAARFRLHDVSLGLFGRRRVHELLNLNRRAGATATLPLWSDEIGVAFPAATSALLAAGADSVHVTLDAIDELRQIPSATSSQVADGTVIFVRSARDVARVPLSCGVSFAVIVDDASIANMYPNSSLSAHLQEVHSIVDACQSRGIQATHPLLLGALSSSFSKQPSITAAIDETLRLLRLGCTTVTLEDATGDVDTHVVESALKTARASGIDVAHQIVLALRATGNTSAVIARAVDCGAAQFVTCAGSARTLRAGRETRPGLLPPSRVLLDVAESVANSGGWLADVEELQALQQRFDDFARAFAGLCLSPR